MSLHIGGSSERFELNMKNSSEPLIFVASPSLSVCLPAQLETITYDQ